MLTDLKILFTERFFSKFAVKYNYKFHRSLHIMLLHYLVTHKCQHNKPLTTNNNVA